MLVQEALETMPLRHRLAITAHCRGNMPIDELARVFGLSADRTRGIVTEAKAMFRQLVCAREKNAQTERLTRRGERSRPQRLNSGAPIHRHVRPSPRIRSTT